MIDSLVGSIERLIITNLLEEKDYLQNLQMILYNYIFGKLKSAKKSCHRFLLSMTGFLIVYSYMLIVAFLIFAPWVNK